MPIDDENHKPALILLAGADRELCQQVARDLASSGAQLAGFGELSAARESDASLCVLVGADGTETSAVLLREFRTRAPDAPRLVLVADQSLTRDAREISDDGDDVLAPLSQPASLLRHSAHRLMREAARRRALVAERDRAREWMELAGLATWSLDAEGNLSPSEKLRTMLGEPAPGSLPEVVPIEEREAVERGLDRVQDGSPFTLQHRVVGRNGRQHHVETRAALHESDGERSVLGVCLNAQHADILAGHPEPEHDELTGLPTRPAIERTLSRLHEEAEARGTRVAVVQIGLDDFKRLNKAYGRRFGDEVLRLVAERLRTAAESGVSRKDPESAPFVGRFGSDEFTVLLPNGGNPGASTAMARSLVDAITEPVSALGNEARVEGCAGIAVASSEPGGEARVLLHQAVEALYDAQERGHRQVQHYAEGQSDAYDQMKLETRLREAVDREEIHLHYQPKVDAQTGQVRGFEALARWTDAELGTVGPAEFIRAAENAGFIDHIGELTLRKAARQTVEWIDSGLWQGRMAVNVSPMQFMKEGFGDWVMRTIASTGLDPSFVELEITESCLVEHRSTVETLSFLRERGVAVAIDDFGTGYSSLQYLRELPLDTLKVDRAFVVDLETDTNAQRLLETIVSLAKSLDLNVVAEGVETSGQWSLLRDLGCDQIQGFRVSPGVPPDRVLEMLEASKPLAESQQGPGVA